MAIVLPSLDPNEKFKGVVEELIGSGFEHIVIVNDGSDAEHLHWFEEAAAHEQCTVLTHEVNRGKGRGLKDGFAYVAEKLPEVKGVITIDGDGQHLTRDIIACGEKMLENPDKVVLGCRDFNQPGIPPEERCREQNDRASVPSVLRHKAFGHADRPACHPCKVSQALLRNFRRAL